MQGFVEDEKKLDLPKYELLASLTIESDSLVKPSRSFDDPLL